MAWTESYHCDVCNKSKSEQSEDWWLAWFESMPVVPGSPEQPVLKMTRWNVIVAHAPEVRHLCGARCSQTLLDRWMTKQEE